MERKRVEYENYLFTKDKELESNIHDLAKNIVNRVIYDIGKDYEPADLEAILSACIHTEFTDAMVKMSNEKIISSRKNNGERQEFTEFVKELKKLADDINRDRNDIIVSVNGRYKGTEGAGYNEVIVVASYFRSKKEYKIIQCDLGIFILPHYPDVNKDSIVEFIKNDIDKTRK